VLWGGNQVAIKVGLEGMPPLALAAARFSIGWVVVATAAAITRQPIGLEAGQWRPLAGLCLLFVVQIATLNIGTLHTSASRSIVLISAYPFFTAVSAHLLIPGDRLTRPQVVGMVLSFAGILFMFAESFVWTATQYLFGDAVVLLSAALLGLRQVVIKRLVADTHPYKVLYWQALMSLPVFVGLSLIVEGTAGYEWSWRAAAGVLYQGVVVAGACFIILVFLLSRHSAGRLSVFGFLTPVVGVALSMWITGDEPTVGLVGSMALVGFGILVTQRRSIQPAPPPEPPARR
jgi:drug/metabolite transporter (DMT)-like permease